MKTLRQLTALLTAVFAMLFTPITAANNGVEFIEEYLEVDPIYVPCLSEHISGKYWITVAAKSFETPSGVFHEFGNWRYRSEWTGVNSGDIWVAKGVSPGSVHAGPGYVEFFRTSERAKILSGDGPDWILKLELKITVNANGDLKVLILPPDELADAWRCLGPKK